MILLLCHAQPTIDRLASPFLGRLVQPRHYSNIRATAEAGTTWAADNDAFNNFQPEAFRKMLERISASRGCVFVATPDAVGDAEKTLLLFEEWAPEIARCGLPIALVGQDGFTRDTVPWREIDALFLGGTTDWKLGTEARVLAAEARRRGLWVHVGRVNSKKRITYAYSIGADSVDGSSYSRFVDTHVPKALVHLGLLAKTYRRRYLPQPYGWWIPTEGSKR